MGREIHPGELKVQAAQAVNLLNTNSEVLLDLIPQIKNFMQEEQLDGTAWSGLKTVLGDYISVIQGTIAAYAMVMADYQTMVNQIGDEDLVEDELAEQLRVINTAIGINTTCIHVYNRMPRQISNIGPIKKAIQRLTSTNTELNRAAGILQSKLEQIDIIEAATNSLFLTAGSYLDAVKEGYQSIHNSWNGSGYQVSGNRDWKQVTEDAWNAYRNQYAQQARDAVLASQNWCVCSKDPVNLSTGNFIYDKTDLQLQGRMSITFTRYYNAIKTSQYLILKSKSVNLLVMWIYGVTGKDKEEKILYEINSSGVTFQNRGLIHGMYEYSLTISNKEINVAPKIHIFKTNWWEICNIKININVYEDNEIWNVDVSVDTEK